MAWDIPMGSQANEGLLKRLWHTVVGGRQGLEGTRRRPTDGKVWIHLEADDLYELCGKVRDLETELNASFGTETIMLDRPTLTPRRYRV